MTSGGTGADAENGRTGVSFDDACFVLKFDEIWEADGMSGSSIVGFFKVAVVASADAEDALSRVDDCAPFPFPLPFPFFLPFRLPFRRPIDGTE